MSGWQFFRTRRREKNKISVWFAACHNVEKVEKTAWGVATLLNSVTSVDRGQFCRAGNSVERGGWKFSVGEFAEMTERGANVGLAILSIAAAGKKFVSFAEKIFDLRFVSYFFFFVAGA